MSIRIGKPDRSKAGQVRGTFVQSSRPVDRALLADVATSATEAVSVSAISPRGGSVDGDTFLALVVDGRIEPLTVDNLCAYLETRYVLTPVP